MNNPASKNTLTRRALLQHAGAGLIGAAALPLTSAAQSAAPSAPKSTKGTKATASGPAEPTPLNRFPRLMHDFYLTRITVQEKLTEGTLSRLRSRSDAESFIRQRVEKVKRCFGPLPAKTPLNPRITKTVDRDAYTIENLIFDSRPNFPVTGNLYLPKNRPKPLPAVVGVCGHSDNGKAGGTYQSFAQGLARLGYIVLIIDPAGQGERFQCVDANLKRTKGASTHEHNYVGNQQTLVGEFFGTWQAWDGIRALDYLETRPEVNPQQILVTGNSGGGTITTWICALEPRFAGAAPSCFVNTFRRLMEHEEPQDAEQVPPHTLALGLDHADFFLPFLPRSLLLLGQEGDFFDARGLEQSHANLKKLYALAGADDKIGLFVGPDAHGFHQKNREAMYGWFNALTKISTTSAEPKLTLEKDETLWCTPQGQVAPLKPRTVVSFTNEAARALKAKRLALEGEALKRAVAGVLNLPARQGVPDYRILPAPPSRRYPTRFAGNYAVETESGILSIVYRLSEQALVARPPRGARKAVLYVSHRSADAELRDEPLVREVIAAEPDAVFYACDVRGIGESQPNTTSRSFTDGYGSDYFYATYGNMFDRSYPAQRTFDLMRLVDWLKSHGHEEIHLVAKGWGAIPAAFAALLDERIGHVTLKHNLTSYSDVAEAEHYSWPLSSFIPDVLRTFDLPDCYRALAAKGLRQIEPQGAMFAAS